MKRNNLLGIISLACLVLLTVHMSQDAARAKPGTPEAGGSTLIAAPFIVVLLYGTVLLAERRSGIIMMLLVGLASIVMPVAHVVGPRGFFTGQLARSAFDFWFIWTLYLLGVLGLFTVILALQALRRPSRVP